MQLKRIIILYGGDPTMAVNTNSSVHRQPPFLSFPQKVQEGHPQMVGVLLHLKPSKLTSMLSVTKSFEHSAGLGFQQ